MSELATVKMARGSMLPTSVLGHRVGWYPSSGLIFAEGHPAGAGELCPPDALGGALLALDAALHEAGVPVMTGSPTRSVWRGDQTADRLPGFAGVRRLDATVDRSHGSAAEGLAVMAGIAALDLPRMKSNSWRGASGSLETVELRGYSGVKMLARVYDSGVKHGGALRGELLRFEDQRRYVKDSRRGVEELTSTYVRGQLRRRFTPLWRASKGVVVTGPARLAERLGELQDEGLMTPSEAKRVAGTLLLEAAGAHRQKVRQRQRDRRTARAHGLVLADGALEEVEVDLHEAIEECLETDAWVPLGA